MAALPCNLANVILPTEPFHRLAADLPLLFENRPASPSISFENVSYSSLVSSALLSVSRSQHWYRGMNKRPLPSLGGPGLPAKPYNAGAQPGPAPPLPPGPPPPQAPGYTPAQQDPQAAAHAAAWAAYYQVSPSLSVDRTSMSGWSWPKSLMRVGRVSMMMLT